MLIRGLCVFVSVPSFVDIIKAATALTSPNRLSSSLHIIFFSFSESAPLPNRALPCAKCQSTVIAACICSIAYPHYVLKAVIRDHSENHGVLPVRRTAQYDNVFSARQKIFYLNAEDFVDTVITRSTSSFKVNQLQLIVYPCVLYALVKVQVPQLSLRYDHHELYYSLYAFLFPTASKATLPQIFL